MTTLDLLTAVEGADSGEESTIQRAVNAARVHLGMEVAYVSEFVGGQSVFREVDAPDAEAKIQVGDTFSLDDVYCRHILEGRLPEVIPDTSQEPLAASLPITEDAQIGCHLSVPILLPDGTPYGMFCCLSATPEPSLNERDLRVLRAFADLAAHEIGKEELSARHAHQKRERILKVIGSQTFSQVYQPIWNLATQSVSGFECLTRFAAEPARTPDKWFAEAAHAGLGAELEIAAIAAALGPSRMLREYGYVTFNASPAAILSDGFFDVFADIDTSKIILEVTEHARVEDYDDLLNALAPYRDEGLRLAVDDAGAGYASLQHIVRLRPDLIKLDISLTRNVDADPALRALAAALIHFSRETGCQIVAEGIETIGELQTLLALGVDKGQGYLLGRPASLDQARQVLGQEYRCEDEALACLQPN